MLRIFTFSVIVAMLLLKSEILLFICFLVFLVLFVCWFCFLDLLMGYSRLWYFQWSCMDVRVGL